jgi:hypothetical protein
MQEQDSMYLVQFRINFQDGRHRDETMIAMFTDEKTANTGAVVHNVEPLVTID